MYQTWEELEDSIKTVKNVSYVELDKILYLELEIKMQLLCLLVKVLEQMKID